MSKFQPAAQQAAAATIGRPTLQKAHHATVRLPRIDLSRRHARGAPVQTRQLGVQIRQRLLHQIPVSGVLARFQFPKDPGARKLQAFLLPEQLHFLRGHPLVERRTDQGLGRLNLRLDRLTFPTSCHTSIILLGKVQQREYSSKPYQPGPQSLECGSMARAISPSPPTSSTSMTMVLNKLVGWK